MVATQDKEEIRIFLDELEEGLSYLDEAIISLEENPKHQETLEEIFRVAHTIKGSAGFLDLKNLVALGHAMENVFQEFKSGTIQVTTNVINTILECKDAIGEIGQLLGKGQDTSKVNTNHLIEKINGFLAGKSAAAPPGEKPKTKTDGTLKTSGEFSANDYIPDTMLVRIWISQNELAPSIRAFLVNKRLSEYGEIVRQYPSEEDMDNENFVMPESREIRYWIKTDKTKEEVESAAKVDLVDNVGVISDTVLKELIDTIPVEKDEDASKIKSDVETSESVRIPVNRLDVMLNLVGELVIANSGLMQIQDTLRTLPEMGNVFKDVRDRTKELVRISGEIQGLVMNSRLVPISQVFNRFKRFVRDYSTKSGKKIKLTMTGEATELDKKITDEIIKPLTHLVRNSLDHGLEAPEDRIKAGKSEIGTLHLEAYQEGNYINIIILDDGRGLNSQKILEKAINSGMITNEKAMTMSEDEIRDLIFQPGFSTKDAIDEMSGRGVGMDVVKTSVEDLNGTLLLDTEPGKGTRITIKLPLTLAILNALIVKVGNEKYCIPMSSIVETQKVSTNYFLTVDNNEMVRLREKLIPVIRLDKIFPPDGQEPEKTETAQPASIFLQKKENVIKEVPVIVVEFMESPIAILVDQFLNRQEVVIKSLAEHYRTIDGISGASILGDGSIILIIDVHGVIQIFRNQKLKQGIDLSIAKSIAKQQIKSIKPIAEPPKPAPQPKPASAPVSVVPKSSLKTAAPAVTPATPAIKKPELDLADITAMTADEFEMLEDLELPIAKPQTEEEQAPASKPTENLSEELSESGLVEEIQVEEAVSQPVISAAEISDKGYEEFTTEEEVVEPAEPIEEITIEEDKLEPAEPVEEIATEEDKLEPAEPVEEIATEEEILEPAEPVEEIATEEEILEPAETPLPLENLKEIKGILENELIEEESGIEEEQALDTEVPGEKGTFWDESTEAYTAPPDQILQIEEVEDLPKNEKFFEDEEISPELEPAQEIESEIDQKGLLIKEVDDREAQPLSPVEKPKQDFQLEETISLSDTDENLLARHAAEIPAEMSDEIPLDKTDELESLSADNFFNEDEQISVPAPEETFAETAAETVEEPEEEIEISVTEDEIQEVTEDLESSENFEFSVSEDNSISMVSPGQTESSVSNVQEQRLEIPEEAQHEIIDEISLNDITFEEIEDEMNEMENLNSSEPSPEPEEHVSQAQGEELTEFERMKKLIESGEYPEEETEHESIALDHFNKDDYDLTKLNNILEGKDQELVKNWLKAGNQHAIEGIKSLTGHQNIFPGQTRAKKYSSEKLKTYIDRFKNDDFPVIGLTLPMLPIHGMIYFVLTHNNARNMASLLYQTAQMPTPETIDFEPLMEVTNILGSAFTNSLTQITDIPIEPGIPQILENNELLVEAMDNQLKTSQTSNILYIENEFLWGEKEVLAELVLIIPKVL